MPLYERVDPRFSSGPSTTRYTITRRLFLHDLLGEKMSPVQIVPPGVISMLSSVTRVFALPPADAAGTHISATATTSKITRFI